MAAASLKEGWLYKLGAKGWKSWKKRWCILQLNAKSQPELKYYEGPNTGYKGSIPLHDHHLGRTSGNEFFIAVADRTFKLKADSADEVDEWENMITHAVMMYKSSLKEGTGEALAVVESPVQGRNSSALVQHPFKLADSLVKGASSVVGTAAGSVIGSLKPRSTTWGSAARTGDLIVRVLEGRNLPATNKDEWTSDPAVLVSAAGIEHRTAVCSATVNPRWTNETMLVPTRDRAVAALMIKVFCGKTLLGTGCLSLDDTLRNGRFMRYWASITLEKGMEVRNDQDSPAVAILLNFVVDDEGIIDSIGPCTIPWAVGASAPLNPGSAFVREDSACLSHVDQPGHLDSYQEDPPAEIFWFRRMFAKRALEREVSKLTKELQAMGGSDQLDAYNVKRKRKLELQALAQHKRHRSFILQVYEGDIVVVSVLCAKSQQLPDWEHLFAILWTKECVTHKVIDVREGTVTCDQALLAVVLSDLAPKLLKSLRLFRKTEGSTAELQLMNLEGEIERPTFKCGVLFASAGQAVEDDMYSNEHGSPAFEEFLNKLGARVRLKGYTGYSAQLDTRNDQSGLTSTMRWFHDTEVMFHVSTLLQYDPTDEQRIQRKRFIGNDIVMIVFVDGNTPYNVDCMRSQYTNSIVVVQPHGKGSYRVSGGRKKTVRPYGPPMCSVYPDSPAFFDFLLAKCLNGEHATYVCPEFSDRDKRTRQAYLEIIMKESETLDLTTKAEDDWPAPVDLAELRFHEPQIFGATCSIRHASNVWATGALADGRVVCGTKDGLFAATGAGSELHCVLDLASVAIGIVQISIVEDEGIVVVRAGHAPAPLEPVERKHTISNLMPSLSGVVGRVQSGLLGPKRQSAKIDDEGPLSQLFVCAVDGLDSGTTMQPLKGTGGCVNFACGLMGDTNVICAVVADSVMVIEIEHGTYTTVATVHFPHPVFTLAVVAQGLVVGVPPVGTDPPGFCFVPKETWVPQQLHVGERDSSPRAAFSTPFGLFLCYETFGVLLEGHTGKIASDAVRWRGNPVHFAAFSSFVIVSYLTFLEVRSAANGAVVESHAVVTTHAHGSDPLPASSLLIPQWRPGDNECWLWHFSVLSELRHRPASEPASEETSAVSEKAVATAPKDTETCVADNGGQAGEGDKVNVGEAGTSEGDKVNAREAGTPEGLDLDFGELDGLLDDVNEAMDV